MKTLDVFTKPSGFKTRSKLTEESKLCSFRGKTKIRLIWVIAVNWGRCPKESREI